ncbi:MAG: carbohydrate ABC transporter permease [Propionibacteriaceae bacterium]|jgi:raffinose/stachyose/melibiose transport system permease protein|nr:carbohydrate ABC transporter permease [Propionibacteriaceae bacterium]
MSGIQATPAAATAPKRGMVPVLIDRSDDHAPTHKVKKERLGWGSPVVYFISLALIAVCIAPVLYIVLGGFRSNSQMIQDPAAWPNPWEITNYTSVLAMPEFWHMAWNSLFIALISVVLVVVLGVGASYTLARYKFTGRNALYMLFAAGLMFPLTVAITPLYIMMTRIGLANTAWGVILPQVAFGLPQTIIILTPFLAAIPGEIEEAATVDGCSRLGFFFRMALPLSLPGVITVAILNFVGSWNSYMLPLYMFNDASMYTLPLGVQQFSTAHSQDTAQVMAFTSMSMLPALIFFSIFERRIVGGLSGAVKG